MKLLFSLAVITEKNQKVEDLIKPYIRENYNDNLASSIFQEYYLEALMMMCMMEDCY